MFTKEKADGSDLSTDRISDVGDASLELLKNLIQETKSSITSMEKKKKWDFDTSPHKEFGKTLDDTYTAFLLWARVKQDMSKVNVSKALRRLESYAVRNFIYTMLNCIVKLADNPYTEFITGLDARNGYRLNKASTNI